MFRSRWLSFVELAVATVALYVIYAISEQQITYRMAVQFLVVVFILELLDLSMPYGETMPVDSAMVIACLVLLGPITAAFVSVVARVAVQLARRGTNEIERSITLITRRLVAIAACGTLLAAIPESAKTGMNGLYVQGLVAGLTFIPIELLIAQLQAAPRLHERFGQLVTGNLTLQGPLLAAQVSVAVLTVITYGYMQIWSLIVMSLLMVLMRQSLGLFLAIRQAYRATIEALVAAIEAQDPRRRGHAERVESLARSMALQLGIRGRALENLAYAALLHDVDMLGFDSDDDAGEIAPLRHSGETVSSVRFLVQVVPILRLCDGVSREDETPRAIEQAAAVVAVASDLDDEANRRVGEASTAIERVAAAGVSPHAIGAAQFAAVTVMSERSAGT